MIPNNVRTVRLTAAAGTNLARAYFEDRSGPCGLFSPPKALYNPKAFIAHAASLGQACAHCRRSSTAATRRCLASVSVRVARVVLSHPLGIPPLVGRYPANQVIPRGPRPGRRSFALPRSSGITPPLGGLSRARGWVPTPYCPLRRFPPVARGFPRLACLIHAANVRSEPGSNPSLWNGSNPVSLKPRQLTNPPGLPSRLARQQGGRLPAFMRA